MPQWLLGSYLHIFLVMNIDKDEDLGEQHYFFQSSIKMRGNIVVEKTIWNSKKINVSDMVQHEVLILFFCDFTICFTVYMQVHLSYVLAHIVFHVMSPWFPQWMIIKPLFLNKRYIYCTHYIFLYDLILFHHKKCISQWGSRFRSQIATFFS